MFSFEQLEPKNAEMKISTIRISELMYTALSVNYTSGHKENHHILFTVRNILKVLYLYTSST